MQASKSLLIAGGVLVAAGLPPLIVGMVTGSMTFGLVGAAELVVGAMLLATGLAQQRHADGSSA